MMNFLKRFIRKPVINYSIAHPLFSENILQTNFYNELQKNGWCKVVADKPDSLFDIVTIKEKSKNKNNKLT
ncbi:hypothetical protein KPL47_05850 [Clostridium estertheticum]|uniref:hypothetical protein n=1 Tax=Clostridium estertheticum TaxID=238834 RepID=UPI001C0BACA0|nr:hypothetical protein [Clostridium estertheticum]MBU3175888.1 hypothetical protein [Clostridium estertheticum]